MITTIKKVGNSAGVIIPSSMLKKLDLQVGTPIDLRVENGTITVKVLKPRRGRSELTLDWLLADFRDVGEDLLGTCAPAL